MLEWRPTSLVHVRISGPSPLWPELSSEQSGTMPSRKSIRGTLENSAGVKGQQNAQKRRRSPAQAHDPVRSTRVRARLHSDELRLSHALDKPEMRWHAPCSLYSRVLHSGGFSSIPARILIRYGD